MSRTSWDEVANWYDDYLRGASTFHKTIVIPGVLRLLGARKGDKILDVACGQGILVSEILKSGSDVIGVDASVKLIALARKRITRGARFFVDDAKRLATVTSGSIDGATIVLALQNIDQLEPVFRELGRVLKKGGRAVFVITHPCFRIPRQSSWGYEELRKLVYRRIDMYMSQMRIPIKAHPSQEQSATTLSFHRPLSAYMHAIADGGFVVDALEEWVSDKVSDSGPRAKAENRSRAEIPLFLAMRIVKK